MCVLKAVHCCEGTAVHLARHRRQRVDFVGGGGVCSVAEERDKFYAEIASNTSKYEHELNWNLCPGYHWGRMQVRR